MSEKFKKKHFSFPVATSMRSRWMLITISFLLVIFVAFSFLVYQSSMKTFSQEATEKIDMTAETLSSLLSQSDQPMTKKNINILMKEAIIRQYNDKLQQSNSLLSLLGDNHLNIYLYDNQQKLILKTINEYNYQCRPIVQTLKIKKINNVDGFIIGKKIISEKTEKPLGYLQIFYPVENLIAIRKQLINNICLFVLIAFVLSVLCSAILFNSFVYPIKKLIGTMKKIQQNPIAAERTPLPRQKDEIWELTTISNTMIDQIQEYISHQAQFVQDASHELKTPVAILDGHLNLLNRWGKDDPEVLEESLQLSLQEVTRMKVLIEEMLDLTKNTKIELANISEHILIVPLIKGIIKNMHFVHADFQFELHHAINEDTKIIMTEHHFTQLMTIFLDNAIKYSTDRKEVVITLEKKQEMVAISIQDFGEGIAKKDIKQIFNRFYRVDKARSREKGGNGLGLSIAEKLIEGYHGTIKVESIVNEGTTFILEFPIIED